MEFSILNSHLYLELKYLYVYVNLIDCIGKILFLT
jgi:hypothetical protein